MKLFLIDGHALIFKMYYAFLGRPMINTKGVDTSILFGFTKYLLELMAKEQPTHIAVSFDPPGGTFRNEMYPAYKANRAETPQLVRDALEPLTGIVKALNIPVLMIRGFEADDVIGSAAKRFAGEGFDVYMVTPDKDYGQLIGEHIFQYKPGKGGGDSEVIDVAGVCAKYGIERPEQVIDILTICGDASDNVPGVKGVGEVGAGKLLGKYGSVENIYAHIDELTPHQKELFEAARDHIALSKQLVTIKTDIPLDITADDMALRAPDPSLAELFNYYEFTSLKRYLSVGRPGAPAPSGVRPADSPHHPFGTVPPLSNRGCYVPQGQVPTDGNVNAVIADPDRESPKVSSIAIEVVDDGVWVADRKSVRKYSFAEAKAILEDAKTVKAGFALKAQIKALDAEGIALNGRLLDIELMHYLLNPERSHKLEFLTQSYLGVDLAVDEPAATGSLFGDDGQAAAPVDLGPRVEAMLPLSDALHAELSAAGLLKLYDEIEEPLQKVLARMELTGVRIDVGSLRDFAESLREKMLACEARVREIAGNPELNVASPKQMGELIFEQLALDPKAKKSARGAWPTDEETLSFLADRHPVINLLLDYRGLRKLLSTYIEPLAGYISPKDGRVHTTFNQALTSTGRLSSSNPNLQNIPVRSEEGREIRKAFVPQNEGWVMMSSDYSQIELRVMAHMSCDTHLLEAFRQGVDVHAATAAKIFRKPVEEVTGDERKMAKTVNFGIMYGMSSFGLAQRLKCSRSEAKQLIEDYFESFPAIRLFIDSTLAAARETLYTETLFGRRRYIPDINSNNGNVRSVAERNAVNAPIQGTAADIIKLAMIKVDESLRKEGLRAKMVLQIHDEILLEVPEDEIDKVKAIVERDMQGVVKLSVPLTVECNYGRTWIDAH
ncbi:MAG: DNA polymerase I [Bacteroidales bacterium]|nr:DNA polymerase I [Bacteroidales bacterium]